MEFVDPRAFEFAMSKINDGMIFERFAQDVLSQVLGYTFIPVGGTRDHGIDGLEHCFQPKGVKHTIFQISIESDAESKVHHTIETLKKNQIECLRLFYVTNRSVSNEHEIVERIFKEFNVSLNVYDAEWLRGKINTSEGTVRTYLAFVETYCHEFISKPLTLEVADLVSDPRVFVYLSQQWENRNEKARLDELLADTLILIGLEGTDPDRGILRSEQELVDYARENVKFHIDLLQPIIHIRLDILSRKPSRKIRHHTDINKYCLPYQTRLELKQKQLADAALHSSFFVSGEERLRTRLKGLGINVQDAVQLLISVLNRLFKLQGIEFASFINKPAELTYVEKSLSEIISIVVDESHVAPANKDNVKQALLGTAREIIYKGKPDEVEYLRRLSSSYMMLFLLQCDPKLAIFFSTMASHLRLLVDNSLLVPAMSEYPLDQQHRRHWNLLKKAQGGGVRMYITSPHLSELAAHLAFSIGKYKGFYEGREGFFDDETKIMYVEEILIRSYLYARIEGLDITFEKFLDNFATPKEKDVERQLIAWLRGTFGIELLNEKTEGVHIDQEDLQRVTKELSQHKDQTRARSDAHTVLAIFSMRELDNEEAKPDIFGYRTWWLSKDTTAQRALQKVLGERYAENIHMRADFLNNYIALSPHIEEINRAFDALFPTLVGVSISRYIPTEICQRIQLGIREHAGKNPARVAAILGSLSDKLKGTEGLPQIQKLTHFLDEKFAELKEELEKTESARKKSSV